ncbi:MAG: hypothetical protein A7315_01435 [Candidatus Altiarchaeales archaeon WOR_SM1_79]|nr:MAG: hypothetical protein A7315_01435 [Candidatus Altiarchaeales archaeon WOR_SM1_79]
MNKVEPEPKEFWDDMKWGRTHYSELIKKYPDKWVAIINKKVVAVGESINDIKEEAKNKTGKMHIPVMFIECGDHIY